MNWYYESAGQQQGPVSDNDLDRLLAEGKITLDTLVWREGMSGWTPLRAARPSAAIPPATTPADLGMEVTRPAQTASAAGGSDVPQPGWIRCSLTGRYFPPSEIIYLEGKPYSAAAKPQVVASLQSGGALPSFGSDLERTGPAWEQRETLGFFRAIWETGKGVLFDPAKTFSGMRRTGGLGSPVFFYFVCGAAGMLFMLALFALIFFPAMATAMKSSTSSSGGPAMPSFAAMGGIGVFVLVFYGILILVMSLVAPFINGGILHLCLMMVGGARQPFETTLRVWAYANGSAMLLMFVPVCGWMAAGIWGIVATCIGVARTHEIPTGKAVFATLLPIIACCVLQVGFQILMSVMNVATSRGQ